MPENGKDKKLSKHQYLAFLRTVPFFAGLTDQEIGYFIARSAVQEYRKGLRLFEYGDPAELFYVVLEGWIKLYRDNAEGEETVIALVSRGETFSETATFEGSDYPFSAQVVGGSAKCLAMPAGIIREKVHSSPKIALTMLASLCRHMDQLSLTYENITRLTSAQRLGCFLLKLSMDEKYAAAIRLPYDKFLVASRLGMQPETFSRAMRRLKRDLGITFRGRDVQIPDIAALQSYCEVHCFQQETCSPAERLRCRNTHCDVYRILCLM